MSTTEQIDCIVVGAGAAGMMCAARLTDRGKRVILIEKNAENGKKLSITGKGRCNLTNNCDRNTFFENVVTNPKFLYGAYGDFNSQDTMSLFESLGVPLKTERGNRVFPVSDKASDIVKALVKYSSSAERVRGEVCNLIVTDGNIRGVVLSDGRKLFAKNVVIATGGASYPKTGSDGKGYELAKAVGHNIISIQPSLVPIEMKEIEICKALQGLSLKNVSVTVYRGEKKIYSDFGEMLFTHFGVSGPVILSASSSVMRGDRLSIDLKPALDRDKLDKRIRSDFLKYNNRNFGNALSDLLPSKMIDTVIMLSGIPSDRKINGITKEDRFRLLDILKDLSFTVSRLRPVSEAVITKGGVDVKEINPRDMQSRIVNGLYFCGEIIDVDAFTGGFNLQIAFSTAAKAAENI